MASINEFDWNGNRLGKRYLDPFKDTCCSSKTIVETDSFRGIALLVCSVCGAPWNKDKVDGRFFQIIFR